MYSASGPDFFSLSHKGRAGKARSDEEKTGSSEWFERKRDSGLPYKGEGRTGAEKSIPDQQKQRFQLRSFVQKETGSKTPKAFDKALQCALSLKVIKHSFFLQGF